MRDGVLLFGFLCAAAALEVLGDATVRRWAEGGGLRFLFLGGLMLAAYGVAVNKVPWEMYKQLGIYVCFFATAAVLWSKFVRHEAVPGTTWRGLGIIITGGLYIQYGPRLHAWISSPRLH